MKITKRQLRRIIKESQWGNFTGGAAALDEPPLDSGMMDPEQQQKVFDILVSTGSDPKKLLASGEFPDVVTEETSTIKYNANPALKGDQTKLPDKLQKGIIDAEDDEEKVEEAQISEGILGDLAKNFLSLFDDPSKSGEADGYRYPAVVEYLKASTNAETDEDVEAAYAIIKNNKKFAQNLIAELEKILSERVIRRIIREEMIVEKSEFAPTAEEEAKKINAQTGAGYVTDQAFWEERGVITGEDLALSVLGQTYSDLYKDIHGFRPRGSVLQTVEEYTAAINDLDEYYASMIEQDEIDAARQAKIEKERAELSALMPGKFDFEQLPKASGMGRRMENKMKITKRQLRALIKEEASALLKEAISEPELKAIKDTVRLLKLIEQIPALEGLWGEEEVARLLDPDRGEWVVKLEQAISNLDPQTQEIPQP